MSADDPSPRAEKGDGGHRALSEQVAEELHHRILTGEIPLGSRLRQDQIAAEFKVSRMPVREAFRALHGQGVIEILPRRGALVHGPTPRDIRDNYQVRAELEAMGAELASERIDDDQLARLRTAAACFDRVVELAQDPATLDAAADVWRTANDRFHMTIVEAADNSHLTKSIQELRLRIPHNSGFVTIKGSAKLVRENADEHRAILEAIESHDAKKARRLARAHVLRSGEMVARHHERELMADSRRA